MNKRNRLQCLRIFLWIVTVLWMTVIFLFSAQSGSESSALSGSITQWLVRLFSFQPFLAGGYSSEQIEFFVRKLAHFSEYAILGMLFAGLVLAYCKPKVWYLVAVFGGVAYAALDEWHQSFTPNRVPAVKDVMIDSSGVIVGVLFVGICAMIWNRKSNHLQLNKAKQL